MSGEAEAAGRVAADMLEAAGEKVREAADLAQREHPSLGEVYTRLGALHDLAARLPQHLASCANALDTAARQPGLTSTDPDADPRVVAGHAAWQLREICGGRYVSGLVEQLSSAWSAVSTLTLAGTPVEDSLRGRHGAFVADLASALDVEAGAADAVAGGRPAEVGEGETP